LRRDARYVVIEAQAGDDGADTFALAEFADAALLTVEVNRTSREEGSSSLTLLQRLHIPVAGAVVLPHIGSDLIIRPPQPGPGAHGQPADVVSGR
ncbi:MAG TPA: hypothetical protein VGI74_11960, partial [Streptosporangiaceae bacterium]